MVRYKKATVMVAFFIFILTCNLLGLIPFFEYIRWGGGGGSTATGNFSVTVAFAILTFFFISLIWNIVYVWVRF